MANVREIISLCEKEIKQKEESLKIYQLKQNELEKEIKIVDSKIRQLVAEYLESENEVNVGKIKSLRDDTLISRVKDRIFRMSTTINEISDKIETEEDALVCDIDDFETRVDELLSKNAGNIYRKNNLAKDDAFIGKELDGIKHPGHTKSDVINSEKVNSYNEFFGENWEKILDLFETENQLCKKHVESIKA